ncbi:MAG: type I-E CRISPR-associated endoribonuclease Cas2e [Armatimonadetes bacterium]|nr:type I-E CRISPR-associated endoribonuclease Cas2e [Armatimonadota bacterium]
MVVLMLERAPAGLRGEISRWMIEPRTGVFVGNLSAMVRDKLWEKAQKSAKGGAGMLLYNCKTEQGFGVRTFGDISREPVNVEGLWLVRTATS